MDLPSNSNASREPKAKNLEKVTLHEVTRRKKTLGRRFLETFVAGDPKQVLQYVIFEVLIPAARDTAADAVSQGIERWLFGEGRSSSRRTGSRPSGGSGYVSYNRFSSALTNRYSQQREDDRPPMGRSRSVNDFEEIVVATRPEAEGVISGLFDIISKYEQVSIADLYELVGWNSEPIHHKWGWKDLRGATARRITNGYILDLPRPEPFN